MLFVEVFYSQTPKKHKIQIFLLDSLTEPREKNTLQGASIRARESSVKEQVYAQDSDHEVLAIISVFIYLACQYVFEFSVKEICMLTYMRKHSKSWIAYTIFGAIIVVFVLWGGSSYVSREANKIAKIDRHIISMQNYQKAYSDALKAYQNRFGDALTPEMIEKLDLKTEVLNQLIDDYILQSDAREMGVAVSDEELQLALRQVPAFLENGNFSMENYQRILEYQRITPSEFEQQQRKSLLKQRFYSMLTENVVVSDKEVEAAYKFRNDTFDLYFIPVGADAFVSTVNVTPEDVHAYYDEHKEKYKIPPKTTIAFIEFPVQRSMKDVEVTLEEAQDYYDGHKAEFTMEAKVHPKHILLRVPPDAAPALVEEKETLAREITERASSGEDFVTLAKKYSEDADSAKRGGDIGLVPVESLPEPLGSDLYEMSPGEIKGPIRTMLGYHVVKLEAKQEETLMPFEEVSSSIVDTMKFQRAKIIAGDEANSAFVDLYEQEQLDFQGYAHDRGLDVKEIGPFSEGEDIEFLSDSGVTQKAFTYPEGEIGDVADLGNTFIVYMITKRELARIPELSEVNEKVAADVRVERALERAKEHASQLASMNTEDLLKQEPSSTGQFKRTAFSIPKLAMLPALKDDLDSLESPAVYPYSDTVYVVWIKDMTEADIEALDEKKTQTIRQDLLSTKREMVVEDYMNQARKRHKVIIEWDKLS
ncbi:MAG: SurA N-terminal domain-containing protein [Desulfomonilia bacterium]